MSNDSSVDYSNMEYSESQHASRGFPVEFAALGFLIEEPMHGYALRSRIEEGLGPLWQVASSQLYQVLHRLETREYVKRVAVSSSEGPAKTIYHVTPEGEVLFWKWTQAPVPTMRNVRVEFAAKIYFLRRLKVDAVSAFIDQQLGALEGVEERLLSDAKRGSDDPALNMAWLDLQLATVKNFYRWLTAHRTQLSSPKETE